MKRTGCVIPLIAVANGLPAVSAIGPLRRCLLPGLSGIGRRDHVALTFDDGPDPRFTPRILDELATHGVHVTFFVLGEQLARYPDLGRRIVATGHEIAMHGWTHRRHLLRGPLDIAADMGRCHALISALADEPPRFWRPPHGELTSVGLAVALRLGLRPVLWNVDGREWRNDADPGSVARRLLDAVHGRDTVLLHDSNAAAPPGTAREVVQVLPALLEHCQRQGWTLGPLHEHGLR